MERNGGSVPELSRCEGVERIRSYNPELRACGIRKARCKSC